MVVVPFKKTEPWSFEPARSGATLSSRIVDEVCAALFEKRLASGDFLGTEKNIAERPASAGSSRGTPCGRCRRSGVAEISVGSRRRRARRRGQSAAVRRSARRPARASPGVSAGEMHGRRSARSRRTAAELAAENADASRLCAELQRPPRRRTSADRGRASRYTQLVQRFHLARGRSLAATACSSRNCCRCSTSRGRR